MVIAISSCFSSVDRVALPFYENPYGGLFEASASGTATAATAPPKFSLGLDLDHWMRQGFDFVRGIRSSALSNQFLSEKETSLYHQTEADVVRAAALYLIHPINQALTHHPAWLGATKCLSEFSKDKTRSDMVFYRNPNGRVEGSRAVAAVEFKRRSMIDSHAFRSADKAGSGRSTHQLVADGLNQPGRSFFKRNSLWHIKQAASYALTHRTRYVALFDWDYLVLVRFCDFDETEPDDDDLQGIGVGDFCNVTVIRHASDSWKMRTALLGFLAEAYRLTPELPPSVHSSQSSDYY